MNINFRINLFEVVTKSQIVHKIQLSLAQWVTKQSKLRKLIFRSRERYGTACANLDNGFIVHRFGPSGPV